MVHSSSIFESFSKVNVLVVGDVMIDRYLKGNVSRVSPEAPVPVVHLKHRENRLGGAGNVALNIKSLGATPYLVSVVGNDQLGKTFKDLLPEYNISSRHIVQSNHRQTTVKTRIIAQSQHLLRVDTEDTFDLNEEETNALLSVIRDILDTKDIQVILFQDYNKGVLSEKVIREIILESIKRDIPTAVDPKFKNFWTYKHATLFKPNLKEIREQTTFPIEPTQASLKEASNLLRSKLAHQYTLITLSEKGLFVDDKKENYVIPTVPRVIADVCGAGDSVISVASVGLALGLTMKEIAVLSNLAGGQVCEKVGVVPIDKNQLKKEYEQLVNEVWRS